MAFVYWIHLPEHTDLTKEGYIGITTKTVNERFKRHLKDASRPSKNHIILYRAMNKYNGSLIVTTLIESGIEYARFIEQKLRPDIKIGWNTVPGGAVSPSVIFTEEIRAKISASLKGRIKTDAEIEKIRKALTGRKRPASVGEKVSLATKGRKRSVEVIAKMKAAVAGRPWLNPRANLNIWANADKMCALYYFGANTLPKLAKILEMPESNLSNIFKKFKAGWVPIHDVQWLKFVEEYEEQNGPSYI